VEDDIPLPPMIATSWPPWMSVVMLLNNLTSVLSLEKSPFLSNDKEKSFTVTLTG
jgi:hypothetical protein